MDVLAADLGGTRIKLGLVHDGAVVARRILKARANEGLGPRLEEMRAVFSDQCRDHAVRPAAVAFALPQFLPPGGRPVAVNGKYPDTPDLDLAGWAHASWGVPVTLINDAHASVLGKWRSGAGRDCADVVMMTLGTGIGGDVVSGGRLSCILILGTASSPLPKARAVCGSSARTDPRGGAARKGRPYRDP